MDQVAEISLALVFLIVGIQSRPLDKQSTTQQPSTQGCPPLHCLHESKCYADGEEISRGSDGSGWCYGLFCDHGDSIPWDNFNCEPSSTLPPTTKPSGCFDQGVWYPRGSEISRGSDGKGWCYGKICSDDGQVQSWDNFDCDKTTTTQPTPHPTTIPSTYPSTYPPTHSGCYYNGAWYPPNSDISKGQDGRWCYGTYCTHDSQIIAWDNWNCGPSTTKTTSSTPTPTSIPFGCLQNGIWYPIGSDISSGSDGNGWCYGEYCDQNGQIVAWDNWNCGTSTTAETTTHTTTPTPTSLGCIQNGIWYPAGSDISSGSDGEGWCYGEYCTHDGKLQLWDDFNCTTTQPTTLPTTLPKGCYYEGKWYSPGIFEDTDVRGCRYGAQCGLDGIVTRWEEFNCQL